MRGPLRLTVAVSLLAVAASGGHAWAQSRTPLSNHTPWYVGRAADLGPADPHEVITVSLHLKTEQGLDRALAGLYDPQSPTFHQWLTSAELAALLAPQPADEQSLKRFLGNHHLEPVSSAPGTLAARGAIGDIESAFDVSIDLFRVDGLIVRANTTDPKLPGELAASVSAVSGLAQHLMRPHLAFAQPATSGAFQSVPLGQVADGLFYSAQCFLPPVQVTFHSATATAVYFGNRFGQSISNTTPGTWAPCGYQPSDIWTAYHLSPLYQNGIDGTGETIAVIEAYGSSTIQTDAAEFSAVYGLPAPNITVIGTPSAAPYDSDTTLSGWADETSLDVEWVHSIAPGAGIVVVVSPDETTQNLANAVALAASLPGVVAISGSFGWPESEQDAATFAAFEQANKLAAARGISVDYSSGDAGDYVAALGYSDVEYPASSPWATALGGVSVGLHKDGSIAMQTGWGANITRIADTTALGNPPLVPPLQEGFLYGAGGGESGVFHKPPFQRRLAGPKRLLPDVSWVGDPYTGVEAIVSADDSGHNFLVGVVGGTSVASPMFTALWTLANEQAEQLLGTATYTLYGLSSRALTDVLPVSSPSNPAGFILSSTRPKLQVESARDLAQPLSGAEPFYSALFDSNVTTRWFVLTFGTDSSLRVTPGWDAVTGLGTPNGVEFVHEAAGEAPQSPP